MRCRRGVLWAVRNPANFALLATVAMIVGVLGVKAVDWASWRLFPPSLAGSWESREVGDLPLTISLIVKGHRIEGRGSLGGAAFDGSGIGSWRAFDLRLRFEQGTVAATGYMLDRDALVFELKRESGVPIQQILYRRE